MTDATKLLVGSTDIYNAFSNATVFASKDQTRPVLCCVKVDYTGADTSELRFEATDSYALIRETVLCTDGPAAPFSVLLDSAAVKAVSAFAKSAKCRLTLCYDADNNTVTVSAGSSQVSVPTANRCGEWPRTDAFFTDMAPESADAVGMGSGMFAKLGKLKSADGAAAQIGLSLIWQSFGPLKPARFSVHQANIAGLLMPVRIK